MLSITTEECLKTINVMEQEILKLRKLNAAATELLEVAEQALGILIEDYPEAQDAFGVAHRNPMRARVIRGRLEAAIRHARGEE